MPLGAVALWAARISLGKVFSSYTVAVGAKCDVLTHPKEARRDGRSVDRTKLCPCRSL